MKVIARTLLYGLLVLAVVVLVMKTTVRPPDQFSGSVTVTMHQQGFGPVKVTPRPSLSLPPLPTPFTRPLASTSVERLLSAAKDGDAGAQCELGIRYANGSGVSKDAATARLLFGLAAKQRNACGINNLGNTAYEAHDFAAAARYYKKAADMGYPAGYYNLGEVAKWGPDHNEAAAYQFFKTAAMRGYVLAYDLVGRGILEGRDPIRYPQRAQQWFLLGAQAGDEDSIQDLAWYYLYRSKEPDRYQKALHWLRRSASTWSDFEIGRLYAKGLGVSKNMTTAGRWYKLAADQGYAAAQVSYGDLLRLGEIGNAPDPKGAYQYYLRAAKSGYGDALYQVGKMTEHGTVVPRDSQKAESWYAEAAAHCSGDALFRLAEIRAVGSASLPKDPERAVALAGVSIMCGEDSQRVGAFLKAHKAVDTLKVNRYWAEYRSLIYDFTGNPNFAPPIPSPLQAARGQQMS